MNLSKMTEDVSNITVQPNQFIGKAADLKKLFDKSGEDIKAYINNTLIPELEKLKLSDITNDGNGSSPFATTEEVAQAIANLVDSSPDTLNTFKKLANALGNDPEFSTTVLNLIGTKVDKATYEEDKSSLENDILDLKNTKVANADFLSFKNEYLNKMNTKVDKTELAEAKNSYEQAVNDLKEQDNTLSGMIDDTNIRIGNLETKEQEDVEQLQEQINVILSKFLDSIIEKQNTLIGGASE